jgi:hypothetical protein
MDGWKRMLWTVGLVFAVAFVTQLLSAGPLDVFHWDMATVQAAVNAGVAALIALGVNAAAPWIKQYGFTGEPKA